MGVAAEYELRCPVAAEWRLRGKQFYCGRNYVCLLRLPENTYQENCGGLDYSSSGNNILVFYPINLRYDKKKSTFLISTPVLYMKLILFLFDTNSFLLAYNSTAGNTGIDCFDSIAIVNVIFRSVLKTCKQSFQSISIIHSKESLSLFLTLCISQIRVLFKMPVKSNITYN